MVSPFLPDADKVAAVRAALPAVEAGIYLETASVGPMPAETAKAMADVADWELRVGRAHHDYRDETAVRIDEARAAVAAIVGGSVDTLALIHTTADAVVSAATTIDWRAGDRIVTSDGEDSAVAAAVAALRDRAGVELVAVPIGAGRDGPSEEELVARFEEAIDERTRLVVVSHVASTTGALLPVRRIAAIAKDRRALTVVDGAQAAGAIPVRVGELGTDLYLVPAGAWLLGPEGIGAAWISPSASERLRRAVDAAAVGTAGSFHRPSIVGMARSCGWLAMYVGLEWAHRRAGTLAARAAEVLATAPNVTVLTPRNRTATIVTLRIEGWRAAAALEELGARVFAIATTIPALDAIRLSVGFFNTERELARIAECVALLGSHRLEDLPPRRRLQVLGSDG